MCHYLKFQDGRHNVIYRVFTKQDRRNLQQKDFFLRAHNYLFIEEWVFKELQFWVCRDIKNRNLIPPDLCIHNQKIFAASQSLQNTIS